MTTELEQPMIENISNNKDNENDGSLNSESNQISENLSVNKEDLRSVPAKRDAEQNNNKKNKRVKNVTLTVRNFSLDPSNFKDNKYINFSVDHNNVEAGAVILMVRNRSEKSGLFARQSGSTPGRTVSTIFSKLNNKIGIN